MVGLELVLPLFERAFARPAQHGVDEARCARAHVVAGQHDRFVNRGVGRGAQGEELVDTHARQHLDGGFGLAIHAVGENRVPPPLQT